MGINGERPPRAASTGASVRGRSTVRPPPAITARRARRSARYPGPGFQGIGDNSAESSYYTWVDQHNTFGLGEDVPMSTANLNDGLVALKDGKMILLRVPYRWASTPKGWTGASMTRRPAGRAEGCGQPAATGRRGSWKAAKARSPSPYTSSCAPIPWRGEGSTKSL